MLFNEPKLLKSNERYERHYYEYRFSALQRAEIAEIPGDLCPTSQAGHYVSVLFNEPKLLKFISVNVMVGLLNPFQCSSTSRNC